MNTSKISWSSLFTFPKSWIYFIQVMVCLTISSIAGAIVPRLITELPRNYHILDLFYHTLIKLLLVFIIIYINTAWYQIILNKYIQQLILHVRSLCYQRWILNYDVIDKNNTETDRYPLGEVLSRIMNDTESLRELITSGTFRIVIDIIFIISCLISFIGINKVSGVGLIFAEIFATLFLIWGSRYMRTVFLKVRIARGKMSRTIANVVGGLKETYYLNHQNYASKKGNIFFNEFLKRQNSANIWDASYFSIAESLYPLLLVLVVYLFPYSHITEAAIIFAIIDLIQRSINPIKEISGKIANIQRAISGINRIDEFLDDLDKLPSSPLNNNMEIDLQTIEIQIPYYSYPNNKTNQFALKNIQLNSNKGELIGIIGPSGSGKTTILNIIAGKIIADSCKIIMKSNDDQQTLYDFTHQQSDITPYRRLVGIVSQDSHIFSESLAFNITLEQKTPESFYQFWTWITSEIAYLSDWGIKPSHIVDPHIMSSGQKQLLSAIRSCFLKKKVVLFDEISSALDPKLEQALRKVILLIQKKSFTIIVAHRIETITNANNIYVIDNGQINSSGTHGTLQKTSPLYQRLIKEISVNSDNLKPFP